MLHSPNERIGTTKKKSKKLIKNINWLGLELMVFSILPKIVILNIININNPMKLGRIKMLDIIPNTTE